MSYLAQGFGLLLCNWNLFPFPETGLQQPRWSNWIWATSGGGTIWVEGRNQNLLLVSWEARLEPRLLLPFHPSTVPPSTHPTLSWECLLPASPHSLQTSMLAKLGQCGGLSASRPGGWIHPPQADHLHVISEKSSLNVFGACYGQQKFRTRFWGCVGIYLLVQCELVLYGPHRYGMCSAFALHLGRSSHLLPQYPKQGTTQIGMGRLLALIQCHKWCLISALETHMHDNMPFWQQHIANLGQAVYSSFILIWNSIRFWIVLHMLLTGLIPRGCISPKCVAKDQYSSNGLCLFDACLC